MANQHPFEIQTRGRGTTEITGDVARVVALSGVAAGKLLLGTWQGIYLWEHRTRAHLRRIVVTLVG